MTRIRQAATERTIRLAKLHIAQQENRIERQIQLIAELEADGHIETTREARQLLKEMNIFLARMEDDLSQAEQRLQQLA